MKTLIKPPLIFLLMALFINPWWSSAIGDDHSPNSSIHDLTIVSDVVIPDLPPLYFHDYNVANGDKEPAKDTLIHKPDNTRDVIEGYIGWAGNPESLGIYIDDTWTEAEKDSCRAAIARWNDAGCWPQFTEVANADDADITITQGDPGKGNAGLYSWETDADGKVTGGTITIAEDTSPLSLKEVVTHELGHAIGLDDTDEAANADDVMKGSGPSNGSDGNLSQHDSTEMLTAAFKVFLDENPFWWFYITPTWPTGAIIPGHFTNMSFELPELYPPETEYVVQPVGDPLLFVEYAFLEGNQLNIGMFSDPLHGSGQIYFDILILPPDGDPQQFCGIHYMNSNPVPKVEFSCPFEAIQIGDMVHVDWVDYCDYPFTNPLRSQLIVDGHTHYKVKPNGDYAIHLEPGLHQLHLEVDDYQGNVADSFFDIYVEIDLGSVPWEEPFEDYPPGSDIVGQGGWEFWFGAPSSPGARVTSNQVHTGDQALKITGAEDPALADDILHQFTGCNSGMWKFSTWQFIPISAAGGTTYLTLLDQYGNDIDECHWATQLKFDPDLGVIESDFDGATLPLIKGQWVEIGVVIDFDNDWQSISYNGQILTQKSWTLGVPQELPGILNLAAIDLYANTLGNTPVYYDDFVITDEFENYPIIICPPDISVSNEPDMCGAADVDLGFPEILNPDGTEVITNNAPDIFPVGMTTVVWTVSNSGGYTTSCDQIVTVLDEQEPEISPLSDMEISNEAGECGAGVDWDWPEATDNCGIESLTGNFEPGMFFPVGLTDVVYTATDVSGNQAYAGFTVAVLDVEGPELTEMPDIDLPNDPGECGEVWTYLKAPEAEDNCGIESLIGNFEPGVFFPVGLTDVVYTATDVSGNQAYTGFTVAVLDVEEPELTDMPDIESPNDPGECGAAITWELPTTTDNCSIESLTGNFEPGMLFPVGLTDVVYTATDVSGNQAYTGFTVTVFDTDPPELSCPGDMVVNQSSAPVLLNGATPEGGFYEGPGVFDGVFYPAEAGVGTHQINYLYTNPPSGCTYACSFSISVAGGATQTIALPEGWSGISSYIEPTVPLMDVVLNPVMDDLNLLYNFEGMYYPGQNINTLGEWNTHSGYIINVSDDVNLAIHGDETPDKVLLLDEGWNIMPVLNNEFFDIEYLFAGVDALFVVKEVAGQGVYWPQIGINSLGIVEPGKSYYTLMSAPAIINFGTASTKSQYEAKPARIINSPWNTVTPGPASHVVAFRLAENVFQNGDVVGGFNTDGACTGLVQLTDANAPFALNVFGNTEFTNLTYGLEAGEAFSYKLYRPSSNETFTLEVRYNEAMNNGYFETNGLSEVKSVKLAPVGVSDLMPLKVSIYPNPNDGTFTVDGNGEHVEMHIFNAFGEQVYSSDVVLPHEVHINDRLAGVYFIKITSTKGGYYGKLIIK